MKKTIIFLFVLGVFTIIPQVINKAQEKSKTIKTENVTKYDNNDLQIINTIKNSQPVIEEAVFAEIKKNIEQERKIDRLEAKVDKLEHRDPIIIRDTVFKEKTKIIEYIPRQKGIFKGLVGMEIDTVITIKEK
jgi:hypothetical protein